MSYVGGGGAKGNASSYTMTLPTVAAGDVMVLYIAHTNTVTFTGATIGGTAVWSSLTLRDTVIENALYLDVYTRTMSAADSGKSFVVTSPNGASKTAMAFGIFRGADTTNPLLTSGNEHDTTSARTTPALTLPTTCDVVTCMAERISAGANTASTAPSGITKITEQFNVSASQNDIALGYAAAVAAGTAGPYTWAVTGGATTARRIGHTAALRPSGYTPPAAASAQFLDASGTLRTIYSTQFLKADGTLADIASWSAP